MRSQAKFTGIGQDIRRITANDSRLLGSCLFNIRRRTAFMKAQSISPKKAFRKVIPAQELYDLTADDGRRRPFDMARQDSDLTAITGQFLC